MSLFFIIDDRFAARKVSPRFVVDQYEKQEMKKRFKYAVVEDFEPGDSISMQYRQNLKDPKDVPILVYLFRVFIYVVFID